MDEKKFEAKFWEHLKSDRTVMLGLAGQDAGHTRPMTAQVDDEIPGVVWFFTSVDNAIAQRAARPQPAIFAFSSKGNDLFASVGGTVVADLDRAVVERLWNPFAAAWYEGGKDDPKLMLLRFEPDHAEIWLNEYSLVAGLKMLIGRDPKKDYKDKVAKVDL